MNRGVTCALFGSLKSNLAAAFCIDCKGLIELAGRPAKAFNAIYAWTTFHLITEKLLLTHVKKIQTILEVEQMIKELDWYW